jgi:hypothetical protein
MKTAPELARSLTSSRAGALAPATRGGAEALAPPRPLGLRLGGGWLPRAAWTMGRTGRPGLVGIALLLAAGVFLLSTHLRVGGEVAALRADLAAAQAQAHTVAVAVVAEPAPGMRDLPARAETPAILRQVFARATQAHLTVDTASYEVATKKGSAVVRTQVAFPVTGPYPQVRAFIDTTLATMPAVAISELVLERKSIADGNVVAQIRMTVFTRSAP